MESNRYLLCSHEITTCYYPELDQASSHSAILHVSLKNIIWFVTCEGNASTAVNSVIWFVTCEGNASTAVNSVIWFFLAKDKWHLFGENGKLESVF